MGCDQGVSEKPPYCKPKCKEFRLSTWGERVRAQCVKCNLQHEFTIVDGLIKIDYGEIKNR